MNFPSELKYVETHEWVKEEGDLVVVGITDFAQDSLGDLVFVNLPEAGDELVAGEEAADVESVKAVSGIISPVTGVVTEVNEELLESPEQINESPYEAWLFKVKDITDMEDLMDADEYERFCKEEDER